MTMRVVWAAAGELCSEVIGIPTPRGAVEAKNTSVAQVATNTARKTGDALDFISCMAASGVIRQGVGRD